MKRLLLLLFLVSLDLSAELIAHRGVYQTYHREGLSYETCTAIRIENTGHKFLENTIESIEAAFAHHAEIVELDIHPTTEVNVPDNLIVFHDWTLNCRTNATCSNGCLCNDHKECVTNKQSVAYLQDLDLGHGYTFDGGKTFPFRGQGRYLMPTFDDILVLLQKYPTRKILVNVKGNVERTAKAFIRIIKKYPHHIRSRLLYPMRYGFQTELEALGVQDEISQGNKECLFKYLKVGWLGTFPKECHKKKIMIPIRETLERVIGPPGRLIKFTSVLWGWPERFIKLAHKNGTKVYASQVDTIEEYNQMMKLNLDGVMTNKIEVIGPYSQSQKVGFGAQAP